MTDISTASDIEAPLPQICTLLLDALGVVIAAVRSNVAQNAPAGGSVAAVDETTFAAARAVVGLAKWDGTALHAYVPPTPPVPVPLAVTRLQGRLALSRAGLLAKAEAAVQSAGGETAIWYADAQTWRRDDPHVAGIGQALGLASADVDALFTVAAAI